MDASNSNVPSVSLILRQKRRKQVKSSLGAVVHKNPKSAFSCHHLPLRQQRDVSSTPRKKCPQSLDHCPSRIHRARGSILVSTPSSGVNIRQLPFETNFVGDSKLAFRKNEPRKGRQQKEEKDKPPLATQSSKFCNKRVRSS
uniref:Uncharacterized protein n=1 Tax=Odontella aurita TaxID=265563 RepID=A0A7S4JQN0_9STRA|mmetsp:Transcript_51792/g.155428  ORF Transcript_51792/g.155428 Transcript_51792/m.155428 type:complete len:142 (+) Transcript_51792:169-594(+)